MCPSCNCRFELRRSFSETDEAAFCPACNTTARKLLSAFSASSKSADGESSSIPGMGSSCSTCSATSCATCNLGS
ncbi:MAG: FmdB family zinc ribbon protein [Dehalococcoidia bacterium]